MECFICELSGGERVYNLSDKKFEVVKESAKLRAQYGDVKVTGLASGCELEIDYCDIFIIFFSKL